MTELIKWDYTNVALFSFLFLITTGLSGSLTSSVRLTSSPCSQEERTDKQLGECYSSNKITSTQCHRTQMRKLDNSNLEDGQDPEVVFCLSRSTIESMGKPVTKASSDGHHPIRHDNEYEIQ